MGSLLELKKQALRANLELPKRGLVVYTFGNASAIDRERGVIAIKPSGVSYEELTVDMISVVDMDNRIVEGRHLPSSDTKTHLLLYRHFPNIGGVVHTHSTHATAWAQARMPIPCLGTTHADHAPAAIPCTAVVSDRQIARDYEEETGRQILKIFRGLSYEEIEMVLVASHGAFTWGATPEKAVYNSVVLEELAKMASLSLAISPQLGSLKRSLVDKHFSRKHGAKAYYGQTRGGRGA